jgi:hypothetical protein
VKYSVRGNFNSEKQEEVTNIITNYPLWRPFEPTTMDEFFSFEVFLNALDDKTNLFNDLKSLVQVGDFIDWHECTHDENVQRPCEIAEEYRK